MPQAQNNSTLHGLSSAEAARLLKTHGPNQLAEIRRRPVVLEYLSRFGNPLVIILLLAAGLSFYLGDTASFVIIIVIVLVSTTLDFVNSYRSQRAAEALKERVRVDAEVYRDGKLTPVPLVQLVPGDVVRLAAGKLVPGDGQILEGNNLTANESSLTGESYPQSKPVGSNVYLGSSITSGSGFMVLKATGHDTKFSHVAGSLASSKSGPTEFDREITSFSVLIIKITMFLVIFIFAVNALMRHELLEALLFSVALAVGLTPELLPLIITLNLTKGSLAMSKHGVIVKHLASIQNLGSMDVLCTDKTGTLTEDHIALVRHVDGLGKDSAMVLELGYVVSVHTTSFQNPLDAAVRRHRVDAHAYHKLEEIPYDFERKRESVIVRHGRKRLLITKGAPEEVMRVSTHYEGGRTFEGIKGEVEATYEHLSEQGFRVLAVAYREIKASEPADASVEHGLTFCGYMAFLDPAKQSTGPTLEKMRASGITVKIITGDNALVTRKIANDIGLPIEGVLTGREMERLTPHELADRVNSVTIFARVNPEQKLAIIQALRHGGHVVGYLGDGINDAPALQAADVSISVNNAVDVAKSAADMILLHKSLADLHNGVIEGRRTFANTFKYLMMSLGSNFGNMFSMAGGSLILPFLPMRATQILLTNLLYDTSQFSLPLDGVDEADLRRPQKLDMKVLKRAMWLFGPLSSVFDFATFAVLLWVFHLPAASFQTGWFLESVATQTLVVYVIRTRRLPFIQSRPSPYLVITTLTTVIIGYTVALTPLANFFGFGPLPPAALAAIVGITVAYLGTAELVKRYFFRALPQ